MTHHHLSIDYDEGVPKSYRGIVLEGEKPARFMTGDPQADWQAYLAYAKSNQLQVLESSSVTHFVFDNVEWHFVPGGDGREHLVAKDRSEWLDEIARLQSI